MKFKGLIFGCLFLVLCLIITMPTLAGEKWEVITDELGRVTIHNPVTGHKISTWFEFDEKGNRVYLDLAQYAALVNAGIDSSEAANMISKSPFAAHNIDSIEKNETDTILFWNPLVLGGVIMALGVYVYWRYALLDM